MDRNELSKIQQIIAFNFKNLDLLQQAFVRRSYSKEHGGENNEVLEFIGDKVLDFIVVKILSLYLNTRKTNLLKLKKDWLRKTHLQIVFII